jgi:hypothetical protein
VLLTEAENWPEAWQRAIADDGGRRGRSVLMGVDAGVLPGRPGTSDRRVVLLQSLLRDQRHRSGTGGEQLRRWVNSPAAAFRENPGPRAGRSRGWKA